MRVEAVSPLAAAGLPQTPGRRWEAAPAGTRLEAGKRGAEEGSRLPPRAAGGPREQRPRNEEAAGRARRSRAAVQCPVACLQTLLTFCLSGMTRRRGPRTVHHYCLVSWGRREGASGEGREGIIITITRKGEKKATCTPKKPVLGREIRNSHSSIESYCLCDLHYNAAAAAYLLRQRTEETCKMGERELCTFCVLSPPDGSSLSISFFLRKNHQKPHPQNQTDTCWRGDSR